MRNYEDLHVWQKAHVLTLAIYKATRCFPNEERFGLTSQIRRSCASVGANLAEGWVADLTVRWRDSSTSQWDRVLNSRITYDWHGIWICFLNRRPSN